MLSGQLVGQLTKVVQPITCLDKKKTFLYYIFGQLSACWPVNLISIEVPLFNVMTHILNSSLCISIKVPLFNIMAPVVGIEPVWKLSQIFIKSMKFTKLLTTFIDMVEWIDEDAKLTLNHANGKTYKSFNQLQHQIEQKLHDEKGSRVMKSWRLQIHNEKCWQSAWDNWKSIAANWGWYCGKFVTSKSPWICIMCVMSITSSKQVVNLSM